MLTLREPIKLQSVNELLTVPQAMNEKINANYMMIASRFEAKDLLFLLNSEVELPENNAMMTSIEVVNANNVIQQLDIDVINNVVNRILLSEQADFTYQDNVYISSVLQKLGISDVKQFMHQVHILYEENKNVYELLNVYTDNRDLLLAVADLKKETRKSKLENKNISAEDIKPVRERYYIHNEIYDRLQTSRIYHLMSEICRNNSYDWSVLWTNELKVAEQNRTSHVLALSENKRLINNNSSVLLTNHSNVFETGEGGGVLENETQVLERVAGVMLLNLIDNTMVSRIEEIQSKPSFWININYSVKKSVENAITRFQTYHQQYIEGINSYSSEALELNRLFVEEKNILNKLVSEINKQSFDIDFTQVKNVWDEKVLKLEHIDVSEEQTDIVDITSEELVLKDESSNTNISDLTQQMLLNQTQNFIDKKETQNVEQSFPHLVFEDIPSEEAEAETEPEANEETKPLKTDFLNLEFAEMTKQIFQSHKQDISNNINIQKLEEEHLTILNQLPMEERLLILSEPYVEAISLIEQLETQLISISNIEGEETNQLQVWQISNNTVFSDELKNTVLNYFDLKQSKQVNEYTQLNQNLQHIDSNISMDETIKENTTIEGDSIDKRSQREKKVLEFNEFVSHTYPDNERVSLSGVDSQGNTLIHKTEESLQQEENIIYNNSNFSVEEIKKQNEQFFEYNKSINQVDINKQEMNNRPVFNSEGKLVYKTEINTEAQDDDKPVYNAPGNIPMPIKKQSEEIKRRNAENYNKIFEAAINENRMAAMIPHDSEIIADRLRFLEPSLQRGEELPLPKDDSGTVKIQTSIIKNTSESKQENTINNNLNLSAEEVNKWNEQLFEHNKYLKQSNLNKQETQAVFNNEENIVHKTENYQETQGGDSYIQAQALEEDDPVLFRKQLEEINRRNIEKYEKVFESVINETKKTSTMPDRSKMIAEALRSLDNPEQLIKEMLMSKDGSQPQTKRTPLINAILENADENTKKAYETFIYYENNPEEFLESGILSKTNIGALNADILESKKILEKVNTVITNEHEYTEKKINENTRRTLTELVHPLETVETLYQPREYRAERLIHKRVDTSISEEILEQLEQQKTEQTNKNLVTETVTNETINKTEINNITQEIVNKNATDITEIINRTLARQINAISDKVYSQMERKLQTERTRRGRI